jgi:hypothetical protein
MKFIRHRWKLTSKLSIYRNSVSSSLKFGITDLGKTIQQTIHETSQPVTNLNSNSKTQYLFSIHTAARQIIIPMTFYRGIN